MTVAEVLKQYDNSKYACFYVITMHGKLASSQVFDSKLAAKQFLDAEMDKAIDASGNLKASAPAYIKHIHYCKVMSLDKAVAECKLI